MYEQQLLELIQNSIIPDATKLSEFHEADFYSEQYNLYGELKCLKKWYPRLFIEKKKYDELMQYEKVRYICSTDRGVYSFDLKKLVIPDDWWQPTWVSSYSTYYHREIDGGDYKLATKLPIGWAKNITEQIGWPLTIDKKN